MPHFGSTERKVGNANGVDAHLSAGCEFSLSGITLVICEPDQKGARNPIDGEAGAAPQAVLRNYRQQLGGAYSLSDGGNS